MTSSPLPSFTTGKDTIIGLAGKNETFIINSADYGGDSLPGWATHPRAVTDGDTLDGGDGIDTLKIVQSTTDEFEYLSLDLTTFDTFQGVEHIVVENKSIVAAEIRVDQRSLAGITRIDGGTANTRLYIEGGIIDLRGKTLHGISSIVITDPSATILFDSLETAQTVIQRVPYFSGQTEVVLKGDVFSADETTALFENGVHLVTDENGSRTYGQWENPGSLPVDERSIANLDGDHVFAPPGTPISLDGGLPAVVSAGEMPKTLWVSASGWEGLGSLSLDPTAGITLEESPLSMEPLGQPMRTLKIGGKTIGTLYQDSNQPDQLYIVFATVTSTDPVTPPDFPPITPPYLPPIPDPYLPTVSTDSYLPPITPPYFPPVTDPYLPPVTPPYLPPIYTPAVTAAELEMIVRALRYTTSGAPGSQEQINFTFSYGQDMADWRTETYSVTAHAMPSPTEVLTADIDIATSGTDQADVFAVMRNGLTAGDSIDGGGGEDTLWMAESGTLDLRLPTTFTNVEVVRGSNGDDTIYVSNERLAGIQTIDGGGTTADGESWDNDHLVITGQDIDLRGKQILGFDTVEIRSPNAKLHFKDVQEVSSFVAAMNAIRFDAWTPELILDSTEISRAERAKLFDVGFVKITDGAKREYVNNAPVLKNIDGDQVTAAWNTQVHLDVGANAVIENPEGRIGYLGVYFQEHLLRSAGHNVEIDGSGAVRLVDGWTNGGRVVVNNREIGSLGIWGGDMDGDGIPDGYSDLGFGVQFNDKATEADAQAIIQALTYRYSGNSTAAQKVEAWIYLVDGGQFATESEATITINVAGATPPTPPLPPPPPTSYETTSDFTLPADALTVTATGTANVKLTGNDLGNIITGNDGKNTINAGGGNDEVSGGRGNDMLAGGLGLDVLSGGSGKDVFVFNAKLGTSKTDRKVNFDAIKDFSTKDDSVYLDNAIFKKLGKGSPTKPVKLNKDFFIAGTKAKDKNDYVVYDKKTGVLSYDADGSGKGQAVEFALLKNKPTLKVDDFFVI